MSNYILAINPGSTSTKIAVFDGRKLVVESTIRHDAKTIEKYENVGDQHQFRKDLILNTLKKNSFKPEMLSAVVGRGGLLAPMAGGTYRINDLMLEDLRASRYGEHASNLGAMIADEIATELGIDGFIVDPVVVDEMDSLARVSGMPEIDRASIFHALNQKAVANRYAEYVSKKYRDLNLIIAHLGGGVSVGVHRKGRVIDVNNALDGDGPFSPERSGGVPIGSLVELCFVGNHSKSSIKSMIKGKGGLVAYLGTNDGIEIEKRILEGDKNAALIFEAMAYQIAKEIGAGATVLHGEVDAIILTGGLAYGKMLTDWIRNRVNFIAPVEIYGGEDEMSALAMGALRVLIGDENANEYLGKDFCEND